MVKIVYFLDPTIQEYCKTVIPWGLTNSLGFVADVQYTWLHKIAGKAKFMKDCGQP